METKEIVVIIRLNLKYLENTTTDLKRFADLGYERMKYEIPMVRTLVPQFNRDPQLVPKPLLLSYGFLRMPIEYTLSQPALSEIREVATILDGYFYRSSEDLQLEQGQMIAEQTLELEEEDDTVPNAYPQVLVKTVEESEVVRLFQVANGLDIYDAEDPLEIGKYIILQTYPFNGLAAQIKQRTSRKKLRVELLETGIIVSIDESQILYSPPLDTPDI